MSKHDTRLRELRPRLRTVAVTGTNGKTTTASMVASIVAAAGEVPARVTTLGAWVGDDLVAEEGSIGAFAATVERAVALGVRTLAVETSSRGLAAGFARRWPPDVAVFTNLSRDHLDRHGSPEAYLAAKARLFLALPSGGTAVLNADDPSSALLSGVLPASVERLAWSLGEPRADGVATDLVASNVSVARDGTELAIGAGSGLAEPMAGRTIRLRTIGRVFASDALAASLATVALGYDAEAIVRGLQRFETVPGRFEVVSHEPFVVVDYAHTPDALRQSLATARELAAARGGRVGCVFGCGGDRDPGKRPEMGAIADAAADHVVLTNDNPRGEPAEAIADAVQSGAAGRAEWARELDRAEAICHAVRWARPVDVVVIAGKGHETYQELAGARIPFSDREVARAALRACR